MRGWQTIIYWHLLIVIGLVTLIQAGPATAEYPSIVISEIMYHPAAVELAYPDYDYREDAEYIELHNAGSTAANISGWVFAAGIDYSFPAATQIGAGEYLVLAQDAAQFEAVYGFPPDGVYSGKLANDGELVQLVDHTGATAAELTYSDRDLWPVTPDGLGPSLELINPSAPLVDPANWAAGGPTPRAANSAAAPAVPPLVTSHTAATNVPANQPISVSATVQGATSASLRYLVGFGTAVDVAMTSTGGNTFSATLPGQAAGSLIRYRISVTGPGGMRTSPRPDDSVNWWGIIVADAVSSPLPVLRWFVEPADYNSAVNAYWSDTPCNGGLCPAVLAYDGRVWDNVGFRVAGLTSRNKPKKHFRFVFPKNHVFDPPFLTVALDELTIDAGFPNYDLMREKLSWEVMASLGLPAVQTHHVRVEQNSQFYGLYLLREEQDNSWRTRQALDQGALYKFYGFNGTTWYGRWEKKTQLDRPNDDLATLRSCLMLAETAGMETQLQACMSSLVDVPAVVHEIAAVALIRNIDQREFNFFLYQDPDTRLWRFIPDDLDRTWGIDGTAQLSNPTASLQKPDQRCVGQGTPPNELCRAILTVPAFRQMYYRHLRTLLDEHLVTGAVEGQIDALVAQIAADWALDEAKWDRQTMTLNDHREALATNFLPAWRAHLQSGGWNGEVPAAQAANPPISFVAALDYRPASGNEREEYFVLQNGGSTAVDVSGWTVGNAISLTLPAGAVIPAGGQLVVAKDAAAFLGRAASPKGGEGHILAAGYSGLLSNRGGTLELRNRAGTLVNSLTYTAQGAAFTGNVVISEIHYHPFDDSAFEFIELYNVGPAAADLSGVSLAGAVDYTFAVGTVLPAGGYLLVVENEAQFNSRYTDPASPWYDPGLNVAGQWIGSLDNVGEELVLLGADGREVWRFSYSDGGAWPGRADGKGSAAELANAAAVPLTQPARNAYLADGKNWRATSEFHGSPGRAGLGADGRVVVNEILPHTDLPQTDAFELYNTTAATLDLGGWWISDDSDNYFKYQFAGGTALAAHSFLVLDEEDFNNHANPQNPVPFGLNAALGDDLWLLAADSAGNPLRFVDHVQFGATPNAVEGESIGRYPDGTEGLVRLCPISLGATNDTLCRGPILINEIHYNPAGTPDEGREFVELMNVGGAAVSFDNWTLDGEVSFAFPPGLSLAPGEALLLVDFDPAVNTAVAAAFRAEFGVEPTVQLVGAWTGGQLDNGGGTLTLYRPDTLEVPPTGEPFYPQLLHDSVTWDDKAPWPVAADGEGPTLELLDPAADNRQGANWTASLTSKGTPGRDNRDDRPTIGVSDTTVTEGTGGTTTAEFTVALAHASGLTVRVTYATANGSALAGDDYAAVSGTLEFAPGETVRTVAVTVVADGLVEGNEQFGLVLSAPQRGTLGRAAAVATIVDDDDEPVEPPPSEERAVWLPLVVRP